MSKTFLFFAFLSCSEGAASEEPAATAGAEAEPSSAGAGARWEDGASISKGKIASEEAMEGTRVEDEDEDKDEGKRGDGCCCCCCCSWRIRLVKGLMPSTSVGNSRLLEFIVAQLGSGRRKGPCTKGWRHKVLEYGGPSQKSWLSEKL